MKQLVITPLPYKTESMWGYLLRVAECNGYETPARLITYASGKPVKNLLWSTADSNNLAKILNKPLSQLEAIANYKISDKNTVEMKILDHKLSFMTTRSFLNLKRPKICPECIKENGFIDAFWDLDLAVACPHHETVPVNACSQCGLTLSHFRTGLLECRCGSSLATAQKLEQDITTLEMMGIIQAKLHGDSISSRKNLSGFPLEDLEQIPLHSFLQMIFAFSKLKLNVKTLSKFPSSKIVSAACELLKNWPYGFHEFLSDFAQMKRVTLGDNISFSKCFVSLYMAIFSRSFSKYIQFVRNEYTFFGLNIWNGVKTNAQIDPKGEGRFVSISEIERRFGPSRATILKWAKSGEIKLKVIKKGAVSRYVIDVTNFRVPPKKISGTVDRRVAAILVGIPISLLRALVDSGHFVGANNPYKKFGYSTIDLEELRQRLINQSVLLDENEEVTSELISLKDILSKTPTLECKAQFVRDYLDGKLSSYGRTGNSYGQVFFHVSIFNAYKYRALINYQENIGIVTIDRAMELIGTHENGIKCLIDSGYLKTAQNKSRSGLDWESVKSFASNYVGFAPLARKHGTSTNYLISLCDQFDIKVLKLDCGYEFAASFITKSEFERLSKLIVEHPSRSQRMIESSGAVGSKNVRKVELYIDLLRSTNQSLPLHKGAVNMTKVTRHLKMHSNVHLSNRDVRSLLNDYLVEYRQKNGVLIEPSPTQRVRDYIENLKKTKSKPHCFGSRLNRAALARACGISPSSINVYPEIFKLVNEFQAHLDQTLQKA